MVLDPQIFKDYDIRAIVPQQLDEAGMTRLAQAIIAVFKIKSIQIGHDMRISSPSLSQAFIQAFLTAGIDVVDLGLTATDMLYFAAGVYSEDMAINLSASHNPAEYNGLKIVTKGAIPVSGETGIYRLRDLAISNQDLTIKADHPGKLSTRNLLPGWIEHVLSFIDIQKLFPYKIAIDAGNGMAGYFMPEFESRLPFKVTRLYYELDGHFPHHVPSPIESKNLQDLISLVKSDQADLGMAFDGDGDRVFLVDETGKIVTGTIMTAIIAENLLQKTPGATILYNAIVGRIVPEIIKKYQGKAIRVKVGHTLIKAAMRQENGLFCGEHSGHYYFRENFYADSAIIAALLVLELMAVRKVKLSQLVAEYSKYANLEELNFKVEDKAAVIAALTAEFKPLAQSVDNLDGLSLWFKDWWFNLRGSNTEPLLRLNLEADSDAILQGKSALIIKKITDLGAKVL